MKLKNQSVMGIGNFVNQFYKDLKDGKATGWWGERYSRRGERVQCPINGTIQVTVYDLVEYIKYNKESLKDSDIEDAVNHLGRVSVVLNYKRVYLWEIDESNGQEDKPKEFKAKPVEEVLENSTEEDLNDFVEDLPKPDWDKAKAMSPDKEALSGYASEFGVKLDGRKGFTTMLKSFQGKWNRKKK